MALSKSAILIAFSLCITSSFALPPGVADTSKEQAKTGDGKQGKQEAPPPPYEGSADDKKEGEYVPTLQEGVGGVVGTSFSDPGAIQGLNRVGLLSAIVSGMGAMASRNGQYEMSNFLGAQKSRAQNLEDFVQQTFDSTPGLSSQASVPSSDPGNTADPTPTPNVSEPSGGSSAQNQVRASSGSSQPEQTLRTTSQVATIPKVLPQDETIPANQQKANLPVLSAKLNSGSSNDPHLTFNDGNAQKALGAFGVSWDTLFAPRAVEAAVLQQSDPTVSPSKAASQTGGVRVSANQKPTPVPISSSAEATSSAPLTNDGGLVSTLMTALGLKPKKTSSSKPKTEQVAKSTEEKNTAEDSVKIAPVGGRLESHSEGNDFTVVIKGCVGRFCDQPARRPASTKSSARSEPKFSWPIVGLSFLLLTMIISFISKLFFGTRKESRREKVHVSRIRRHNHSLVGLAAIIFFGGLILIVLNYSASAEELSSLDRHPSGFFVIPPDGFDVSASFRDPYLSAENLRSLTVPGLADASIMKELFFRLSVAGVPRARLYLAYRLARGGNGLDRLRAWRWAFPFFASGDKSAMYLVAANSDQNDVLLRNQIFQVWTYLANTGKPEGMYNLAKAYEDGILTKKNYQEALKWYQKAERLGLSSAAYKVGEFLEQGKGVHQNAILANGYYVRAKALGASYVEQDIIRTYMALLPQAIHEYEDFYGANSERVRNLRFHCAQLNEAYHSGDPSRFKRLLKETEDYFGQLMKDVFAPRARPTREDQIVAS